MGSFSTINSGIFIHPSFHPHPTIYQCSPRKVLDALLGPPAAPRSPTCNQQCLPIFPCIFSAYLRIELFLKILLRILSFRNLFYPHGADKSLTGTSCLILLLNYSMKTLILILLKYFKRNVLRGSNKS